MTSRHCAIAQTNNPFSLTIFLGLIRAKATEEAKAVTVPETAIAKAALTSTSSWM
eukprot:CAMPEP_0115157742 /NCGR_PEP_ID=MMETSP0227-20121206/69198_1 /TAXON_ID=89957 /ORGANISM="Polarella glacialis, Strain CCMP 1383" /LENGTH=54 /DNA_ID=CAMNT_0002569121 /DNA_START=736 /DNA_END=900 /DNA_ORIENTATION=-